MYDPETDLIQLWNRETNEPYQFDVNNLVLIKAKEDKVGGDAETNQKPIVNYRIPFKWLTPEKKLVDALFEWPDVYSYGPSPNYKLGSKILDGYSLPMSMYDKDGANKEQEYVVKLFDDEDNGGNVLKRIGDLCETQEVKQDTNNYKLKRSDLTLKSFYWKEEKGVRLSDKGPVFYPKISCSKKNGITMLSNFYLMDAEDEEGNSISLDPHRLIGKHGKARPVIHLESMYFGGKKTIQWKLYETEWQPVEFKRERKIKKRPGAKVISTKDKSIASLLMGVSDQEDTGTKSPPKSSNETKSQTESQNETNVVTAPSVLHEEEENEEDNDGENEQEEEQTPPPKSTKPVVKKIIRRKKQT